MAEPGEMIAHSVTVAGRAEPPAPDEAVPRLRPFSALPDTSGLLVPIYLLEFPPIAPRKLWGALW